MSKRILLIPSPNIVARQLEPYLPYGLLALYAIGQRHGGGVDILSVDGDLLGKSFEDSEELAKALLGEVDLGDYDIAGISTVCNSFHHTVGIARVIKEQAPGIRVWMGGPHVSVMAGQVLEAFEEVDAVFVGEGESTFAEALTRRPQGDFELEGIAGVCTREYGYVPREPIHNLDELPWIDLPECYSASLSEWQKSKYWKGLPLEVARGCPGQCTFCSTRLYWGSHVRRKSNMRVVAEIRRLHQHVGVTRFDFIGDNFGSPRRRLLQFCEAVSREAPGIQWRCALKLDDLDLDDLEKLWRGGCRGFFVGVESASQETLKRIRKGVCLDQELETIYKAVEMGFEVVTSFIIGFPWETPEDVDRTFKLHCQLLKLGVSQSQIHLLCPLPGTKLLDDYPVRFDRWISDIAMDDIPLDDTTRDLVQRYPDIFPQLGHYDTPHVSRIELVATRDTASQLNYL